MARRTAPKRKGPRSGTPQEAAKSQLTLVTEFLNTVVGQPNTVQVREKILDKVQSALTKEMLKYRQSMPVQGAITVGQRSGKVLAMGGIRPGGNLPREVPGVLRGKTVSTAVVDEVKFMPDQPNAPDEPRTNMVERAQVWGEFRDWARAFLLAAEVGDPNLPEIRVAMDHARDAWLVVLAKEGPVDADAKRTLPNVFPRVSLVGRAGDWVAVVVETTPSFTDDGLYQEVVNRLPYPVGETPNRLPAISADDVVARGLQGGLDTARGALADQGFPTDQGLAYPTDPGLAYLHAKLDRLWLEDEDCFVNVLGGWISPQGVIEGTGWLSEPAGLERALDDPMVEVDPFGED